MTTENSVRHPSGLTWWPDKGMGYYPVKINGQYGEDYWQQYQSYRKSAIADALMKARVDLVEKHAPGEPVVDIGIGSGHFLEALTARRAHLIGASGAWGFDVNPCGIRWLKERGMWADPYAEKPSHICCWDSLEHIEDPSRLVSQVRRTIFVSIPIFTDMQHVLRSKHFKPDEHIWYFTSSGFLRWMDDLGFTCVEENDMESRAGRQEIGTFVFSRR